MASKTLFVGVDVGASELVMVVRRNGKPGKVKTFTNTPEGHAVLMGWQASVQGVPGGDWHLSPGHRGGVKPRAGD